MSVMNRAERRRLDTHNKIKEAAFALLMQHGYAGVTIRNITDLADIGRGTFYLHFRDKDDVIWTVFSEGAIHNDGVVVQSLDGAPHGEKEYRAFLALFSKAERNLPLLQSLFGSNGSAALYQKYLDLIAEVYIKNANSGDLQPKLDNVPLEFMAQYSAGALLRLLLWWADNPDAYTAQDMASMYYETFYRVPPPSIDDA